MDVRDPGRVVGGHGSERSCLPAWPSVTDYTLTGGDAEGVTYSDYGSMASVT